MNENPFLQAALSYAERGWRVLPVHPRSKKPIMEGWPNRATTDPKYLRQCWAKNPEANVGILTGVTDIPGVYLAVIDVDGDLGEESMLALEGELGKLPDTIESHTGKGRHLLFLTDRPLPNRVGLALGIDVRGENGFIVAPPSVHPSGVEYIWATECGPEEVEAARMPEAWSREIEESTSTLTPQTVRVGDEVAANAESPERANRRAAVETGQTLVPVGKRNDVLFKLACSMVNWGAGEETLRAALEVYYERQCEKSDQAPFDRAELESIIKSAMKYAPDISSLAITIGDTQSATWADMKPGSIEWDWLDWLPKGILTMIAGSPGAGKSFLALRIAACFINGDDWPDGTPFTGETGKIIWCETEAAQRINLDRGNAWNLPLDQIYTLTQDPMEDVFLDNLDHRANLMALAAQDDVKLIVIDSLSGAHSRDENSGEMKEICKWLAQVARDLNIPIILTHHLRKRSALDVGDYITIEMIRGSTTIVQNTRCVWGIDTPNPLRNECKRFYVIRLSMARMTDPLGMEVGEGTPVFGPPPGLAKPVPVIEQAAEILLEALKDGPVASKDLKEIFEEEGVSWSTANKAKNKLGISAKLSNKVWKWYLTNTDPPQE